MSLSGWTICSSIGWRERLRATTPDRSATCGRFSLAARSPSGRPWGALTERENLERLLGYLHIYYSSRERREQSGSTLPGEGWAVEQQDDLAGLLVVPWRTPTLDGEITHRGLRSNDLGGGCAELLGESFRLFLVELAVTAKDEDDDVLRFFVNEPMRTVEARRFWAEHRPGKEARMTEQEMEEYDEVIRRYVNDLTLEQRLQGLAPEQIRSGAGLDKVILALPDEALRAFGDDYVDQLPEPTRSAVRARRGQK